MEKLILFLSLFLLVSCSADGNAVVGETADSSAEGSADGKQEPKVEFNADSCYNFMQKQVDFGYRIPSTKEHKECGKYLVSTLERFADTVITQDVTLKAYNGTKLESRNIIASWNPKSKNRIMLCAHWDTRPFCDEDPNASNHKKPVLGANDGASGVGVLLELARQFAVQKPNVAVDIILFDSEDYGHSDHHNSYCLGSQYWALNPHVPRYNARFGILLDMVGGKGARFAKDLISSFYAGEVLDSVWKTAASLGYGSLFVNEEGGSLIDDHYYVNKMIGIPCIDIIDYTNDEGFPSTWHTVNDTMENIDKEVLKAVGNVLITYIYNLK